jgi:DNA mismatch repair protein MutL
MMPPPRIRVLPPELADQIAAGEVVERPASVVKELVENALDARARKIEVSIEGGGLSRLTVLDDGVGMTPEEAHLALKRHATSKLTALDDLFALTTMGFRGEALPSIAAVSRLTLTTRAVDAPDADGAYCLEVTGGIAGEARAVGGPTGTEVEVRELLANVPARLKFMKAEATESAHVVETVLRLALANPTVHFRLRSQGRPVFDLPPHASGHERAKVALGRGSRTPVALHLAAGEENGVHVEAYLGAPSESAGTSRNTYPFVNRRFVRDRGLLQAIVMGYGELIERGRYPLAVVHVSLPGQAVDVNVHPQKLEVRFAKPQEVYGAVRHTIARAVADAPWLLEPRPGGMGRGDPAGSALTAYSLPPMRSAGYAAMEEQRQGYAQRREQVAEALKLFAPAPSLPGFMAPAPMGPRAYDPAPARREERPDPDRFFGTLAYLGQLDRTYLVCEAPGELVLIDQHAAHERVAFQRLREAHNRRQVRTQRLLLPATLELDERLLAVAREHQALLAALGFELEATGASLAVKAMPETLAAASPAEVLTEVLTDLEGKEGLGASALVEEHLDHILATMACHSVVRAGDVLSEREVRALLESMDGVDYRAHCPHGRPVLLRLAISDLERRFGRT